MAQEVATRFFICLLFFWSNAAVLAQKHHLYLFPGQGSDERIFEFLKFDNELYTVKAIQYPRPQRGADMKQYALTLLDQIDTTQAYSFIGVSLGGMLSQELCTWLRPEKLIILSSVSARKSIPPFYRSQRWLPIYRLMPACIIKASSRFVQPLFEPDRKAYASRFRAMLKAKDARFMKRAIGMIAGWQPTSSQKAVLHIHGDNDHTLPVRRVKADHIIPEGSHMMTLTCANLIQPIIDSYLSE